MPLIASAVTLRLPIPESLARIWNPARAILVGLTGLVGAGLFVHVAARKYPVQDWLFFDLLKLGVLTLVLNLACVSLGNTLLVRVFRFRWLPPIETWLISMALGLVGFGFGFYVAGAFGFIGPWFSVVWPLLCLATATGHSRTFLRKLRQTVRGASSAGQWSRVLIAAVAAFGIYNVVQLYLQAMTPAAINYDASWYHLPIAQDYAREGRIVPFYGDYNRTHPHLTSIIHTWGFSFPGLSAPLRWMLALHIEVSIVLWKVVGMVAVARWMLGRRSVARLWPAFFLFPAIAVYDQNIGGSADHFLGLFAAPVFLATARSLRRLAPRRMALMAALLSGAVLTKYQSIYLVVGCGVPLFVVVLREAGRGVLQRWHKPSDGPRFRGWRRLLIGVAAFTCTAVLVASPHFLKNAIFYHNPVYPFLQGAFPTYPYHEQTTFLFKEAFPDRQHVPTGSALEKLFGAVRLFFTYSFVPHYSFNRGYLSAGSLFTLLLPCALLLRDTRRIWLGITITFIAFLTWGFTYVVDRYLQAFTVIPIACALALLVRMWNFGHIARLGAIALIATHVVWGADAWFYSGHSRLEQASHLARSGYENRRKPAQRYAFREQHQAITEATPPDAVILARNYRSTLGIDRTILSDLQDFQSYIFYDPVKSPRELYELYRSRDVTHLLYLRNHRPPSTAQGTVLFSDLVTRHAARHHRSFGSLELVTLPAEPPPPLDGDYTVLVVGMEYPDGWYRVDQLNINLRVPPDLRPKPQPIARLGSDRAAQQRMNDTNAILLGKRGRLPAPIHNQLRRDFTAAENFGSFRVFVRKR